VGSGGFGTQYRYRGRESGQLDGEQLRTDFVANARSLGAHAIEVRDHQSLTAALEEARHQTRTTVIVVETDREARVPGYESWWDVPVAEVSDMSEVRSERARYERAREKERYHL
jgi:3D-(3,5/4)-trihydroxycyclohexane-1,2-dione acylhydrolase (decyclizing)